MKNHFVLAFFCLLACTNYSFSADVILQEEFTSAECKGDVVLTNMVGLANVCVKVSPNFSTFTTCSPVQGKSYANDNCSEDPVETETIEECTPISGSPSQASRKTRCESFADSRVASVSRGVACGDDGELTGFLDAFPTIINRCNRVNSAMASYKLVVEEDDVLSLQVFTDVEKTCEGESTTTTIQVGKCTKVSGAIGGVPGDTFITINAGVEGSKLGNNAGRESVNLFAFAIAMVGALMTMVY